ncbi:MAG: hypothetical protein LPK15_03800 [Alteromonadaceae bacterium]|uniref:hypothetical protein n=1 Tax=Marinobacter sp. TaxID=50741 RepID=UPI0029C446F8|nr:hypothetical protein [Marinobacter sp.]MDX5385266.1 hypothetical protein [Marinobacter sp.]MDX5439555.1 hypothetical protein [Alteromonadaceae bacterium]MDX5470961.1 hypothetical protein [Marinobacter sp.]
MIVAASPPAVYCCSSKTLLPNFTQGNQVFSLKRKGSHSLQLTRTLTEPGKYHLELYLFTPHEGILSPQSLPEPDSFIGTLEHRFSLQQLPEQNRTSKTYNSANLSLPRYEILHGSWIFQYRVSLERLRQQIRNSELSSDTVKRALRLSQTFAKRLRRSPPEAGKHQRYFRLVDIYFSWLAEQFLLECMAMEGFADFSPELRQHVTDFLKEEYRRRRELDYLISFQGTPTRVWNRMNLYQRLIEYPTLLRPKITELGDGTRKLVKAVSTTFIMLLFTYALFNLGGVRQTLSLGLLLGIALSYALRDVLRDDMITGITRWLRKGKARWKVRLLAPYTSKPVAQKKVWLDYRKPSELSPLVQSFSSKWVASDEQQTISYRTALTLFSANFKMNQFQERLSLDCEHFCEMIRSTTNQLYAWSDANGLTSAIQAHPIEKQHDYNLLLIYSDPGQKQPSTQRWRIRLNSQGIVHCKAKKTASSDHGTAEKAEGERLD